MKKVLAARIDDWITTNDPSFGGILLGNNNKDESIFPFDESIFIFLGCFLFWRKTSYIMISWYYVNYIPSKAISDKTTSQATSSCYT